MAPGIGYSRLTFPCQADEERLALQRSSQQPDSLEEQPASATNHEFTEVDAAMCATRSGSPYKRARPGVGLSFAPDAAGGPTRALLTTVGEWLRSQ